eukprot:gene65328-89358_t
MLDRQRLSKRRERLRQFDAMRRRQRDLGERAGRATVEHDQPDPARRKGLGKGQVIAVPLYAERAMFVARVGKGFDAHGAVAWDEVLAQPLCLLHEGMQNRRIFDANLAARGLAVHPVATADSYVALLAMVEAGGF